LTFYSEVNTTNQIRAIVGYVHPIKVVFCGARILRGLYNVTV